MSPLFLTRVRLRQNASIAAIRSLLSPDNESERFSAAHKIVWTLFADDRERKRDFLWREAGPGFFYLLSARRPDDRLGLFDVDEPKVFAPALSPGDRLKFMLRANATVARGGEKGVRGKPSDVVMDAIHSAPVAERSVLRSAAVERAGREWLSKQGTTHGFSLLATPAGRNGEKSGHTISYRTLNLPRRGKPARLGLIDFEGVLEVTDPDRFLATVEQGLGRAKAFGCGLMLIRRA
jgi:CRISPR system Cascade subunit CasE